MVDDPAPRSSTAADRRDAATPAGGRPAISRRQSLHHALTTALARLLAPSLDARLAAGAAVHGKPLLAGRAAMLTSVPTRWRLAQNWEDLLERVRSGEQRGAFRVSPQRHRLEAAEPIVRELIDGLRQPDVSATGVAIANCLLSDGCGPVFYPNSTSDLEESLKVAIRLTRPEAEVLARAATDPEREPARSNGGC